MLQHEFAARQEKGLVSPLLSSPLLIKVLNSSNYIYIFQRIVMGQSKTHGWGMFAGEDISKNELVSEYIGELISSTEAQKREQIYVIKKSSYLFEVNDDYFLDSTYKGNKTRFINHSENPNCIPKVMNVNGSLKIGFYAIRVRERREEESVRSFFFKKAN